MSQENVEIARRSFEAFNGRAIDELISFADPDSEWLPFRAQLEGIVYRGHEGVRQFVRDIDAVAGFVLELRSGQITRVTSHSDPALALAALESAMSQENVEVVLETFR